MNRLSWFQRMRALTTYWLCELRNHPENRAMPGFCHCGEYQPNQAGVPMQWVGDWEVPA